MIDDKELITRVLAGQAETYKLLIKRYEKLVFHMVSRLISQPDDVDDICQDMFVRVYRQLKQFRFESTLATWIAQVAYRLAISHLRKQQRLQPPADFRFEQQRWSEQEDPEQLLIRQDTTAYLNRLISQLPPAYRTVLTLYHWQEFSYEEIGRVMKRVVKKQPLYREGLFYGLLFVAILASLVVGLVLASQFDGHVVASLSAVLYRSSWWLFLGWLFFIGSQWLDQQAFVEQLKHKHSSPPIESQPN